MDVRYLDVHPGWIVQERTVMILVYDSEPWDHIVGIDPGGTTGFCAIKFDPVRFIHEPLQKRIQHSEVFMGQVDAGANREEGRGGPLHIQEARLQRNIVGRLESLADRWQVRDCLHLAIEDFVIQERTKDRSLLSPVRHTSGILALLEQSLDINVVVHFNSAADAKSIVSEGTLRKLGLYVAGQPHAMDAARHAVLVLRKEFM